MERGSPLYFFAMELIIEGEFQLEKFPGKGGWTFIRLPISSLPSSKVFGMIKLSGAVDDFEFKGKHLMPMGNGFLFLPVPKVIRSAIRKEAGDKVRVRLYRDELPSALPEELIACLEDDPGKLSLFQQFSESEQKHWIEYIYSANSDEAKAHRIVRLLSELGSKG